MNKQRQWIGFSLFIVVLSLVSYTISTVVVAGRRGRGTVTKLTAPNTGNTTIGALHTLINTNNKKKSSTFFVPKKGGQIITNDLCWGTILNGAVNADSSQLPANIKMTSAWINQNANKQVTLQEDPVLINILKSQKRLKSNQTSKYTKILLYFSLTGSDGEVYRFYINDPYPGKGGGPAKKIIGRWGI
jgi:hypothetical protein